MEHEFLTVREYAQLKNVTVQSVYKRLKTGLKDYVVEMDGKKYLKKSVLYAEEAEEQVKEERMYTEDYVQLLREQIEDLKQDKIYLQQALDQQQQLSLLDKQQIMSLQERLALMDASDLEQQPEEKVVQPEPEPQQPEKKKGFLARLFG